MDVYEKFFFVLSSLILFVLLYNLLIAYMSDSYNKVMETAKIKDNRQINDMIIELESIMFWNR
jgi:hypothetical protein